MYKIIFIDSEIGLNDKKINDLGAVKQSYIYKSEKGFLEIEQKSTDEFHQNDMGKFRLFMQDADFVCGHNILDFDLKYISNAFKSGKNPEYIDTLYLSALLFAKKNNHSLLKEDKVSKTAKNNPLNDSKKCMDLFYSEVETFLNLDEKIKKTYMFLLGKKREFSGFFKYVRQCESLENAGEITKIMDGLICSNSKIEEIAKNYPLELAYAISYIRYSGKNPSSSWINIKYPNIENIYRILRKRNCKSCRYCREKFNAKNALYEYFGFENFRKYNGEPLQEDAVNAAIDEKSLIAIFPTGGGKSLTFQLPALIKARAQNCLTVVISPLQSLMKDQVDNLRQKGIGSATYINGLLNPIEKAAAIKSIKNSNASIVYMSPESLRTYTMEKILSQRHIDRFVIDEAHCFSSWGQDFRVDYLYIADFIKKIEKNRLNQEKIKVSCFTATAKPKVVSDIRDYFYKKLSLELEIFSTEATRQNLKYVVIYKENDDEKYIALRKLIQENNCPTIVYASRTKTTKEIANHLCMDGIKARPYNGKMNTNDKIQFQEEFIENKIQVIVATSAFGMGVDKDDVQLVIHYDISNSLENYVQEAGRAGRNPSIDAKCYILYNDDDLDKHFMLLNQTKLSMSEIQNVWRAIKKFTGKKNYCSKSALEIARKAGWDESAPTAEIRVKTAIGALENAGYIKRGYNRFKIYASSINCESMAQASQKIERLNLSERQEKNTREILNTLFSEKYNISNKSKSAKIDYMSDILAIPKEEVIEAVNIMRENGILKDEREMKAMITGTKQRAKGRLNRFSKLEGFLIQLIGEKSKIYDIKELNQLASENKITGASVKNIKTVYYFWTINGYIRQSPGSINKYIEIDPKITVENFKNRYRSRIEIADFIVDKIYRDNKIEDVNIQTEMTVEFSLLEILRQFNEKTKNKISMKQIEEAILYLSKTEALNVEGGFLVLYNPLTIYKNVKDNRIKYKISDYSILNNFYKQKIQQIHIVGEYANMMVKNYKKALEFVKDYFNMDYREFIDRYFDENRKKEINRNITAKKYKKLFEQLSPQQLEIIEDDSSKFIVTAAGPGSGKTKILVHKLASLLLLEDIKSEQLLMLTFSRAAATEFKKRLTKLIGNAANFVQIKTFHSYCFDIMDQRGNLENITDIQQEAIKRIRKGEIEMSKLTKSVIVVDEAQDMQENEYNILLELIYANDDIRIILVGDDDQNIYQFRGSSSKYMASFISVFKAKKYELLTNYRSKKLIVDFSNKFAQTITQRIKSNPCKAYSSKSGEVKITRHEGENMEYAVFSEVMKDCDQSSSCILTNTNEEALRINGLFLKEGIKSNLIQSNDGFNLYNLAEVRYFVNILEENTKTKRLNDDIWLEAKKSFEQVFKKSRCFENCMNMIKAMEDTNSNKYLSDIKDFIRDSSYDDFYTLGKNSISVSTIHKSKGREFDRVYLVLKNASLETDEEKRKIFVAMTRAKNKLSIHLNNNILDGIYMQGVKRYHDKNIYEEISEICMELTHRDVNLGRFKNNFLLDKRYDKNPLILSGDRLYIKGNSLYAKYRQGYVEVLNYSKKFANTVFELKRKGYFPYKAEVRYMVKWKNEDNEYNIILPDIYFKKKKNDGNFLN